MFTVSLPQCSLWGCQGFGEKNYVFLLFICSWSYKSSLKSCTTMEQIFGHFLHGGNFCGSIIFFLNLCAKGMILFLLFNCKNHASYKLLDTDISLLLFLQIYSTFFPFIVCRVVNVYLSTGT